MTEYSYDLCKEDYDHIPTYDGNPLYLMRFTKSVEKVLNYVCDQKNKKSAFNHIKLLNKVLARLTGSAEALVLSKEINSLPELLKLLKLQFSDTRTVESIKAEIYRSRLNSNETPFEFLNRMENFINLIYNRYNIEEIGTNVINELMKLIDKEIINHMYYQFDPQLSNFIITHDPENLDDFRKILFTKCQFILETTKKFGNNSTYKKLNKPITKHNEHYSSTGRQQYSNFNDRSQRPFQERSNYSHDKTQRPFQERSNYSHDRTQRPFQERPNYSQDRTQRPFYSENSFRNRHYTNGHNHYPQTVSMRTAPQPTNNTNRQDMTHIDNDTERTISELRTEIEHLKEKLTNTNISENDNNFLD